MSIRHFIKSHTPEALLPFLLVPCRALRRPAKQFRIHRISSKALKYLPYYQDELSREILMDRIEFMKTGDDNIFLSRALKEGWNLRLYDIIEGHDLDKDKYSRIIVIHDDGSSRLEYTRTLLNACSNAPEFQFVEVHDFVNGFNINASDLLVPVIAGRNSERDNELLKTCLTAHNINNDLVGWMVSGRKEDQYLDVFAPVDDEVIIGAGAFNGMTALRFLKWGKGKVKKIYSFDFDPNNIKMCEENLKDCGDKITLIQKGLWDKDEVMRVKGGGSGGSSLYSDGDTEVKLTSIDNVTRNDVVTFIELDIEGAELKALQGARESILKHHPRLAISLYHKPEDICEIPEYILSLVPEYKFYLRHYATKRWETVLYAYCD